MKNQKMLILSSIRSADWKLSDHQCETPLTKLPNLADPACMLSVTNLAYLEVHLFDFSPSPSCSKLMRSSVNETLHFQTYHM